MFHLVVIFALVLPSEPANSKQQSGRTVNASAEREVITLGPHGRSTAKKRVLPRGQAMQALRENADAARGSGRRTLALLRQLMVWYEVDPTHPDARQTAIQLADFLGRFRKAHSQYWKSFGDAITYVEDGTEFADIEEMSQEINSKLRQLTAMGHYTG